MTIELPSMSTIHFYCAHFDGPSKRESQSLEMRCTDSYRREAYFWWSSPQTNTQTNKTNKHKNSGTFEMEFHLNSHFATKQTCAKNRRNAACLPFVALFWCSSMNSAFCDIFKNTKIPISKQVVAEYCVTKCCCFKTTKQEKCKFAQSHALDKIRFDLFTLFKLIQIQNWYFELLLLLLLLVLLTEPVSTTHSVSEYFDRLNSI